MVELHVGIAKLYPVTFGKSVPLDVDLPSKGFSFVGEAEESDILIRVQDSSFPNFPDV